MPPRLLLLIAGSTAVVLGVVWYFIGGIPQSHDEYGKVTIGFADQGESQKTIQDALAKGDPTAIPQVQAKLDKQKNSGGTTVNVPEGEVRLNWEGGVESFGSSRSASEPPDDLEVVVVQEGTGERIETEKSGGYDSVTGGTGWTSWRKFEAPEAGTYIVSANSDSGGAGFLTIGEAFWNPGGSRVLGALLPIILVFGLIFGGYAIFNLLRANR
jgi:hypothetical protein